MPTKKKKKKAREKTPEEKWETLMSRLVLHKGAWAVETDDELYCFPQHLTKDEVIAILRKAHDANHPRSN